MYRLKITLKSNLCAGSGFAYSGIIDSDCLYDKYGIPFISARRIRGCLKDSAKYLGIDKKIIDIIFGRSGNNTNESLVIENARLEYYDELIKDIENCNNKYKEYASKENIISLYTTVKASTELDDFGVAKNESLRFERDVNQYDPITKEEMVFYAEIDFSYIEKLLSSTNSSVDINTIIDCVDKLANATRHIGLKRNRGLGSVIIKLEHKQCSTEESSSLSFDDDAIGFEYTIKNLSPLMLSDKNDSISANFIKGSNVLGALANYYLSIGNDAGNEEFRKLFLSDVVLFSNLYPSYKEKDAYMRSLPVPQNINRLKKTKRLVDLLGNRDKFIDSLSSNKVDSYEAIKSEYDLSNGNQPKKIKDKFYITTSQNKMHIIDVNYDVVYHNSISGKNKNGEDGLLYYLDTIESGQYFTGQILAKPQELTKIYELLTDVKLRFGKSKNTQYGKCILLEDSIKPIKAQGKRFSKGDWITVKFMSDTMLMNEDGYYVTDYESIVDIVKNELGIIADENSDLEFLKTKIEYGYVGIWNMQRPQICSVEKGSVLSFHLSDDLVINKRFIGEKNNEGYGEVSVEIQGDRFAIEEITETISDSYLKSNLTKKLFSVILIKEIKNKMLEAIKDENIINITPSSLGRLTLMLQESMNNGSSTQAILNDFHTRIESIKDNSKKTAINNFLARFISIKNDGLDRMNDSFRKHCPVEYDLLEKINPDFMKDIYEWIPEYLQNILVYQKYNIK